MGTMQTKRRLAAVTGASSGLGYELARQFALHGFDLIVTAADEGIERLRDDFAQLGCTVHAHVLDLATSQGVRAFQDVLDQHPVALDALALSAGPGLRGEFARETSLEEELAWVELDVLATVKLVKGVLPGMLARKSGRVLLTSSVAALRPSGFEAVFSGSKAFLLAFASSLRAELEDSGVTITALLAGPSDAAFIERGELPHDYDPSHVAFLGYQAMMAGEERVVAATLKTRLQEAVARILPEGSMPDPHGGL